MTTAGENEMPFKQWVTASATAGLGGAAGLIMYMHATFATAQQLELHRTAPTHIGSLSVEQYREDMKQHRETLREIKESIERLNRKFDKLRR